MQIKQWAKNKKVAVTRMKKLPFETCRCGENEDTLRRLELLDFPFGVELHAYPLVDLRFASDF